MCLPPSSPHPRTHLVIQNAMRLRTKELQYFKKADDLLRCRECHTVKSTNRTGWLSSEGCVLGVGDLAQ